MKLSSVNCTSENTTAVIGRAQNIRYVALYNCCKKMESLQGTRPLRRSRLKNW